MLSLTGDNLLEGVTLDGNWSNQLQTLPYFNNHTVQQINGSLTVKGVRFRRSFASDIRIDGASLTTDADCRFVEGATHAKDRKSVGQGNSVSVREGPGWGRHIK